MRRDSLHRECCSPDSYFLETLPREIPSQTALKRTITSAVENMVSGFHIRREVEEKKTGKEKGEEEKKQRNVESESGEVRTEKGSM